MPCIRESKQSSNRVKMPDGRVDTLEPVAPVERAARLVSLDITSDSVVVTIILRPAPEHRAVQINWGDDRSDKIDFQLPVLNPPADIPPGSFKIQHAYGKNPATGLYPNVVFIFLAVVDGQGKRRLQGQAVFLTPRFRCVIYPVLVRATHHDTDVEARSEFDIYLIYQQGQTVLYEDHWPWNPVTNIDAGLPFPVEIVAERYLNGSFFVTEMTFADEPIRVKPSYVDDDGIWGFIKGGVKLFSKPFIVGDLPIGGFDGGQEIPDPLIHPNNVDGPFTHRYRLGSVTDFMDFYVTGSVDVIIPLDRGLLSAPGGGV